MSPVLAALAVSLMHVASNNPPTEKLDVADKKAMFRVFSDGKKHVVIAQVDKDHPLPEMAFYGDGKTFYRLRSRGGGGESGVSWNLSLWEPRNANAGASLDYRDGKVKVSCNDRVTDLPMISGDDGKKVVDAGDFFGYRWTRVPYLLARDDKGLYYFVDMQRDVEGKKDMRLYIGPRGKLKLQPLTNIVSDSVGDIFSTKSGELRLISNGEAMKWVQGKAEQVLTRVPVDDNHVLIYTDLGVYERMPLGTPCDDL